MTKIEMFKILVLIEKKYSFCTIKSETAEKWLLMCEELNYHSILARLYQYMRSSGYPPSLENLMNSEVTKSNLQWLEEYIPKIKIG
ncbi:hypothetical protein SM124_07445 [Bacillus sp. 31A1R]|uniref:Uncharacterized protein n=1 Tax=Robertmurraya mangrovi TaxID=3098077 RepID=A0ABU5IWS7_9BACI|nr:hypothetical protein [Bacillus sp. 31A1R]MDZ5471580.1 hypothetical protein [Bacillus sp. 31A1R]